MDFKPVAIAVIITQLILLFLIGCFYLGVSRWIAGILGAALGYGLVWASVKLNVFGIKRP